jgi:hypothetical protein
MTLRRDAFPASPVNARLSWALRLALLLQCSPVSSYAAVITNKRLLLSGLEDYIKSCEKYPLAKDFLNIISRPDALRIVSFDLLVIAFIAASIALLPTAPIGWVVIALIAMIAIPTFLIVDLLFNNRDEAEKLEGELRTAKEGLIALKEKNRVACSSPSAQTSKANTRPSGNNSPNPSFFSDPPANTTENVASTTDETGEHCKSNASRRAHDRRALTGEAGNASRRKVIVEATARSLEWASAWRTQDESGPTFSRVIRTNFGDRMAKIFRENSDSLEL